MGITGRDMTVAQQTRDVLLALLRERQPDLHRHLCRVGRLSTVLGRRLGLDDDALEELRRAADLHDIGKAAIPDAILNKPGPLTDEEWTFMFRHTIAGERILSTAPDLIPVAKIVRSINERWDGTGYPDGLAGEAIPLGSRIIFVCDAFDAMTSERPYYRARGTDEALGELTRGAGTQFDRQVVEAFIECWQDSESGLDVATSAPPPVMAGT